MALSDNEGLVFQVGGDISPLQTELNKIPAAGAAAGQALADAFDQHMAEVDGLSKSVQSLSANIGQTATAASQATPAVAGVGTAIQGVQTGAQGAAQAVGGLNQPLQQAGVAAAQAAQAAQNLNQQLQQTPPAAAGFANALNAAQQNAGDLASQLLKTGAALEAVALPFQALGLGALKTAGEFEQAQIAFTTLLHSADAAKQLLSQLVDFGIKTPFEIKGLTEAAQKLVAMGMSAKDVIPTLTVLGDAVSGLGKGQAGLMQIVDVFAKMRGEINLTARDLQGFRSLGINAAQILADAFGTTAEQMLKDITGRVIKTADAIPVLLAGMNEKFGGMMEAQSHTLLGAWSNIQDQITKTLKAIGDELMPYAKQVEAFAGQVLDMVQRVAEGFGKLPQPVKDFTIALAAAIAIIGPLTLAAGALALAFSTVSAPILAIAGASAAAIAAIAGIASAINSITIPPALKDFFQDLLTFGEIAAAFAAGAGLVTVAMDALAVAASAVGAAFAAMSISGIVAGLQSLASAAGVAITQLILMGEAAWTANTALGSMVSAVALVAAAFVGWEIGTMLRNNVEWIRNMGDAIADLLMKTPLVKDLISALNGTNAAIKATTDANNAMAASVEQLRQKLAAHNIVIQQGSMSLSEYAKTLRAAAAGYTDAGEGSVSYGNTVTALGIKHHQLETALKSAKAELTNVTAAYKNGLASSSDLAAATEKYRAALAAANPELTKTGVIIDNNAKQIANWNKSWDQAAQKAIDAYGQIGEGGKTAAQVLSQINTVLETASLNAGKMNANSKALLATLQDDKWFAQQHAAADLQAKDIQKIADSIGTLEDSADRMAARVPADFASMTAAVAQGANFANLGKSFDDLIAKFQQQLKSLPESMASFGPEIAANITRLQYAKTAVEEMDGALKLIGQDQSMAKLGAQIEDLIAVDQSWGLSANQVQAGLNTVASTITSKVIPAMQAGVEVTPKFIAQLKDLDSIAPGVGTALATAFQGGATKAVAAVSDLVEKSRAGALEVETAFQDLGVLTFDKASQNLKRFSDDIVGSLGKITGSVQEGTPQWDTYADAILSWADKALPVIQKGGTIGPDVVASIAKVAPAFAEAINQGIDPFMAASAKLRTQVVADRTTEAAAYQAAGATMQSTLQNTIALEQKQLDVLIASNAPQAVQLQMAQKILTQQLQIAQATDQTGVSEAALAVKITEVQLATYAAHQQTMGLADAWSDLAKGVARAWDDMEKSLAQAIVAGKGFGDVMAAMLKAMETQIVEVAVKYILGQLVASLLTSLGFSASLITSLGILGPASAASSAAVSASMTAAATAMTTAAAAMSASATTMAATVTTGMTTAATSTAAASTSIVASTTAISASMVALAVVVGAFAAVVGAIAGIISAIEIAHTNKLLGEIEVTTRKMELELGGNGSESIFGYVKLGAQTLQTIMAMLWTPVIALLNGISGNLDDMLAIMRAGGGVGSGGGTGSGSGTGGSSNTVPGVITDPLVASLLAQVQAEQAVVATDQKALDDITNAFNAGKATKAQVDQAQQNLKDAQDQLKSLTDQLQSAEGTLTSVFTGATQATDAFTSTLTVTAAAGTDLGTAADQAAQSLGAMAQAAALSAAATVAPLVTQGVGSGDGGVQIIPVGQIQYPSAAINSGGAGGNVSANGTQPWVPNVQVVVQGNVVGQGGMQQLSMMVGDAVATRMRQSASLIKA